MAVSSQESIVRRVKDWVLFHDDIRKYHVIINQQQLLHNDDNKGYAARNNTE